MESLQVAAEIRKAWLQLEKEQSAVKLADSCLRIVQLLCNADQKIKVADVINFPEAELLEELILDILS